MLWILPTLLVLIVLLIYGLGTFVPHSTNMCLEVAERGVNDCFALACKPDNYIHITGLSKVEFESGSFAEKGSQGKIKVGLITAGFEVVEFIPNYRMAVVYRNGSEHWLVQLSFYRLSRSSCRMVLIAKVTSSSRWQRVRNALGKNRRDAQITRMLQEAKVFLEKTEEQPAHFEDVSAEENPNFSLQ